MQLRVVLILIVPINMIFVYSAGTLNLVPPGSYDLHSILLIM